MLFGMNERVMRQLSNFHRVPAQPTNQPPLLCRLQLSSAVFLKESLVPRSPEKRHSFKYAPSTFHKAFRVPSTVTLSRNAPGSIVCVSDASDFTPFEPRYAPGPNAIAVSQFRACITEGSVAACEAIAKNKVNAMRSFIAAAYPSHSRTRQGKKDALSSSQ